MSRLAVLLLSAATLAFGQAKVAVINIQNAVLETAEIKKAQTELEAKYKPRQAEIEKLQKEIQDIQRQIETGGDKLTQQALQNLQVQGQRRQRELQRKGEDLQQDVDRERNEILQRTGGRMQDVVKKMAEEKGYDIVVEVSDAVYFKPALDITKDAVAAYDKTYPAK